MAVVLADSLNGDVDLTTDNTLYVQNDFGLILDDFGDAIGIDAVGSELLIRGTVGGGSGDGIRVAGELTTILIAATGYVSGNNSGIFSAPGSFVTDIVVARGGVVEARSSAVSMNGDFHSVINDGMIVGRQTDGVRFQGFFGTLRNFGEILGNDSGVRIIGGKFSIWNEGQISGVSDPGVLFQGSGNRLVNSGEIVSLEDAGVRFDTPAGEANRLFNSGLISGQDIDGAAVVGGDGNETIVNQGTIDGNVSLGGGDDLFNGFGGTVAGSVSGGAGNDIYRVDDPALALIENSNGGFDSVIARSSFTLGTNFEQLNLVGAGDTAGFGNNLANVINGNIGDNLLEGRTGDDVIRGDSGEDRIHGGSGNDRLVGDLGDDALFGGPGNDNVLGSDGNDTLNGGSDEDRLTGGTGNDVLRGGNGNDRLVGNSGDDALVGGFGSDILLGGGDADRFVYHSILETPVGAAGRDRVQQFSSAQGDRFDLSGIDADVATAGDDGFTFIANSGFSGSAGELRFVNIGSDLLVSGDVDGDGTADFEILVNNTATLTAADFVL